MDNAANSTLYSVHYQSPLDIDTYEISIDNDLSSCNLSNLTACLQL